MSNNPDQSDQNENDIMPPSVGPEHFDSLDTSDVHISNTAEMFNSFGDALENGPIASLYSMATKFGRQYIEPSVPATDEQISDFNKEAPGVNIPKGTKFNVAQLLTQDQLNKNKREFISSLSKPGIVSGAARFIGDTFGTLADPIGLTASYFAPELVGLKRGFTAASLGETAFQRLGSGAAIGAAQATPQSILHQFKQNDFNQKWSGVQAALNIGSSAFIGGALSYGGHALSKFIEGRGQSDLENPENDTVEDKISKFKPFGEDTSDAAMQTATTQSINGKDVDNTALLKASLAKNYNDFLNNLAPYTQDDAIDALEKSKSITLDNIQKNKDDHIDTLNDIDNAINTDDESNISKLHAKLSNLSLESIDLQNQLDNHNSMLSLIRNGVDNITNSDMDSFVNNMNTSDGNFSNSGGYEPDIDLGDEPENIKTLNKDSFGENYKSQLIDKGLLDNERQELNAINLKRKNTSSYSKMLDDIIKCITGG